MKTEFVASLCDVAADLIAEQPVAAAKLARSLGQAIRAEAQRELEEREREKAEMRGRGF